MKIRNIVVTSHKTIIHEQRWWSLHSWLHHLTSMESVFNLWLNYYLSIKDFQAEIVTFEYLNADHLLNIILYLSVYILKLKKTTPFNATLHWVCYGWSHMLRCALPTMWVYDGRSHICLGDIPICIKMGAMVINYKYEKSAMLSLSSKG